VAAEEFRADLFCRCFVSSGFDPVLTELEHVSVVVWIGPGAALTIECLFLNNFGPRAQTPSDSHFLQSEPTALIESRKAGGNAVEMTYLSSSDFGWGCAPGIGVSSEICDDESESLIDSDAIRNSWL
jgi:hypothetical protein